MILDQERVKKSVDFILNRLLIVFFFAILIIYASREIADLDLWLHLKTGEWIVAHRAVPLNDIFSFTIGGRPWINHEWLFQTIAYSFYHFGQGDGLIFMQNMILIATFLVLFQTGIKNENHIYVFVVLYLTLLTLAYRFTIRPDIFSLFFLALYLSVLKKFAEKASRSIWVLPVLQILWVNIHGFSFTGPLLVLILLVSETLKGLVKLPYSWNKTNRLDHKQMTSLLLVFVLMILASFINPWGLKGAAYPLSVLGQVSGEGKIFFQYIQELVKPITFKNALDVNYFTFYKAFILISLFTFRINQKNINLSDFLLWLCFLAFSFIAVRNVAYFGIVAAYVTFTNLELAIKNKKEFPLKFLSGRFKNIAAYVLVAFLFFYPAKGARQYIEGAAYNFNTYELKSMLWGISEQRYPQKAVRFLLDNDFPERMFNDFNSGAYLIGQAYPKRRVFIDGRTELYGPDFFKAYVAAGEGKKSALETILTKYRVQGFFLTNSADRLHLGLLKYLYQDPGWKAVYFDENAIIFLKDSAQNKYIIGKFGIDLKKWAPPKPNFLKLGIAYRYPYPNINRARLLRLLGCYESAAKEAKIALEIMPNCAEALKYMADHYFYQKNYTGAFKYARNCLIYAPGDTEMRSRLAMIYHQLKEDQKALKVVDAIIKKQKKSPEGFYVKAWILKASDPKQAKELLNSAIKLSDKEPRYHDLLGDLWAKEGNTLKAKEEWKAALEYDSANKLLMKKLNAVP
ncbi:MAG: tetratricopeptide repeat protein [Candidatus Omnitrophota bacterium]